MSRHRRWLVSAAVVAALLYAARLVDWSAAPFAVSAHAVVATALLIQIVEIVPVTIAALALAPRMSALTPRVQRTVRGCCS